MQQTLVTLYFIDSEKKSLKSEGRLIDVNTLVSDPYRELVSLLIAGPKTSGLEKTFPDDVRLLSTTLEKNCIILDFSSEILNFKDDIEKYNIINCILNTLTELNEINSIKLTVNGEANEAFNEEYTIIH